MERTEALRGEILTALDWPHVLVDLAERTAERLEDVPLPEPPDTVAPWFDLEARLDRRTYEVQWFSAGDEDHARVGITFGASVECEGCDERRVEVGFPRTEDVIAYTPGLIEDEVRTYAFSEFSFLEDEVYLPLPNGLIGLGDGIWVVKHAREVHIAARVSPSDDHIRFIDAAIWRETGDTWGFDVVRGSEAEAPAVANDINTVPIVMS